MKRVITFYIDDDVDLVAFNGTLCTKTKNSVLSVTMIGLDADQISECSEWYVPVKGKVEPYKVDEKVQE